MVVMCGSMLDFLIGICNQPFFMNLWDEGLVFQMCKVEIIFSSNKKDIFWDAFLVIVEFISAKSLIAQCL